MAEENGKDSLDWLGCEECRHNQGIREKPVCGHPKGVRFFLGTCCINWESSKFIYLPTKQTKTGKDGDTQ